MRFQGRGAHSGPGLPRPRAGSLADRPSRHPDPVHRTVFGPRGGMDCWGTTAESCWQEARRWMSSSHQSPARLSRPWVIQWPWWWISRSARDEIISNQQALDEEDFWDEIWKLRDQGQGAVRVRSQGEFPWRWNRREDAPPLLRLISTRKSQQS